MKRGYAAVLAVILCAGCAEPAAEPDEGSAAKEVNLIAGKYRHQMEEIDVQMPDGFTPNPRTKEPEVMEVCLSQEKVDEGFEAVLMETFKNGDDCEFMSYSLEPGGLGEADVAAKMICRQGTPYEENLDLKGQVSQESIELELLMEIPIPNNLDQKGQLTARHTTKRIGDCTQ
ncbi:MAG: DUF3617 family protein [Pseudomonadota bacterium]